MEVQSDYSSRAAQKGSVRPYALLSGFVSVAVLATVFSFSQFFLFVPFASGVSLLTVLGFLALVGWVLLVALPPILLFPRARALSDTTAIALGFAVAIYPLSTLAIKLEGLLRSGELWAEYLWAYPILFVIEWVVPGLYIYIAVKIHKDFQLT